MRRLPGRVAALRLLVVASLACPATAGGAHRAAGETCGVSCPCDEASSRDAEGAAAVEDEACRGMPAGDRHAPADDGCPDGCPGCGCCPLSAVAVAALPAPGADLAAAGSAAPEPPGSPEEGGSRGVFRPPRS